MAKSQLRVLSGLLRVVDENFNLLYEELNRSYDEREYSTSEDLTAEVLPLVLSEVGLSCNQRDINNILTLLFSRGIRTVGELLELAVPTRLEIISNTYVSVTGRDPTNLEIIATLAAMRGAKSHAESVKRIKLQIDYLGAADTIRQDSRIEDI
jgi:hypothetical protein